MRTRELFVVVFPHRCELQVSIVIGHVVQHVSHGNHHWQVSSLLLLLLLLLLIIIIVPFLWLLETIEEEQESDGGRYPW